MAAKIKSKGFGGAHGDPFAGVAATQEGAADGGADIKIPIGRGFNVILEVGAANEVKVPVRGGEKYVGNFVVRVIEGKRGDLSAVGGRAGILQLNGQNGIDAT
jgi:hypothetical protein